jgi:hypothetical protein
MAAINPVFPRHRKASTVGSVWVIKQIRNELLLKIHKLYRLPDLCSLWDQTKCLNERYDLFTTGHLCVNLIGQEKEKKYFATFTDWSMDVTEEGVKAAENLWPEMEAAGALNMRIVKTDDTVTRSMTM